MSQTPHKSLYRLLADPFMLLIRGIPIGWAKHSLWTCYENLFPYVSFIFSFQAHEEKEKIWERELRKIKGLYENRLRASQQKFAKMEQALSNQNYQVLRKENFSEKSSWSKLIANLSLIMDAKSSPTNYKVIIYSFYCAYTFGCLYLLRPPWIGESDWP